MSVTYSGTLAGSDGSSIVGTFTITPAPGPVTPPPAPTPARQLSVYLKMWPRPGGPELTGAARPGITEVRLAFLQGNPLALVGWGCQTLGSVIADASALHARGVAVTASIGGSAGAVTTADREACLTGIGTLHAAIGLDRIDWDVEASALRADDVLYISQAAHDRWGILTTMAPNGSNVSTYLPVAVELHRRGLLAAYGQQFYGSPDGVTIGAATDRIARSIDAGIPARLTQVGMWVGSTVKQWTMSQCEANLRTICGKWPEIGGAYLWSEPPQTEVGEWSARMGTVLA